MLGHFEDYMLNKSSSETMLRCIQVDLSTFGLDTYGLVYSMSNPLVDHGVNLLCLSTFRTANVLVSIWFCLLCERWVQLNPIGVLWNIIVWMLTCSLFVGSTWWWVGARLWPGKVAQDSQSLRMNVFPFLSTLVHQAVILLPLTCTLAFFPFFAFIKIVC